MVETVWDELGRYAPVITAFVLVALGPLWGLTRHLVTLVHEAGHAVVALLTGRQLMGIRLHSDTSGLTLSRGKPRGPGMVATAAAGYLAPPAIAALAAWLLAADLMQVLGWIALGLVAGMLIYIRNLFGAIVLALGVFVLIWLDRNSPVEIREQLFYIGAWVLVLGNARTIADASRTRSGRTDLDQLKWLTHVPRSLWIVAMYVATLAAGYAVWQLQGL
jgi:hypothetical protein